MVCFPLSSSIFLLIILYPGEKALKKKALQGALSSDEIKLYGQIPLVTNKAGHALVQVMDVKEFIQTYGMIGQSPSPSAPVPASAAPLKPFPFFAPSAPSAPSPSLLPPVQIIESPIQSSSNLAPSEMEELLRDLVRKSHTPKEYHQVEPVGNTPVIGLIKNPASASNPYFVMEKEFPIASRGELGQMQYRKGAFLPYAGLRGPGVVSPNSVLAKARQPPSARPLAAGKFKASGHRVPSMPQSIAAGVAPLRSNKNYNMVRMAKEGVAGPSNEIFIPSSSK